MTSGGKPAQEARSEVVSVRMTRAEKRKLRKIAGEKKETLSALLIRSAEEVHKLAPKGAKVERQVYRFVIGTEGAAGCDRPELEGDAATIELSEEARNYAG